MHIKLDSLRPAWDHVIEVNSSVRVRLVPPFAAVPTPLGPMPSPQEIAACLRGCVVCADNRHPDVVAMLMPGERAELLTIWYACQRVYSDTLGQSAAMRYVMDGQLAPAETGQTRSTRAPAQAESATAIDPEVAELLAKIPVTGAGAGGAGKAGSAGTHSVAVKLKPGGGTLPTGEVWGAAAHPAAEADLKADHVPVEGASKTAQTSLGQLMREARYEEAAHLVASAEPGQVSARDAERVLRITDTVVFDGVDQDGRTVDGGGPDAPAPGGAAQ